MNLKDKHILLIATGSIAAQKTPVLKNLIEQQGGHVNTVLTKSALEFIKTKDIDPDGKTVFTDMWDGPRDKNMPHIKLSRDADLIVVAPASADIIADKVQGRGYTMAALTLLASDKKILMAPAMNKEMWDDAAVQRNVNQLTKDGVLFEGPAHGEMACGEIGFGRMSEPEDILNRINTILGPKPLDGKTAIVTSGPTFEPIDPVRFIGNRSSGKQGHAIAEALSNMGADVTLISGPVSIPDPIGVTTIHIQTAREMLAACEKALPADIAICCAAVSDWAPEAVQQKIKKSDGTPTIKLKENPDILATLSSHKKRPALVIGFAAETQNIISSAQKKLETKKCDAILANDVSDDKAFGQDQNSITFITKAASEAWPEMTKLDIARKLADYCADTLNTPIKEAAE